MSDTSKVYTPLSKLLPKTGNVKSVLCKQYGTIITMVDITRPRNALRILRNFFSFPKYVALIDMKLHMKLGKVLL